MPDYEIPRFLRLPTEDGPPPKSLGLVKSVHRGKASGLTRAEFSAKNGPKASRTLADVKARLMVSLDRHIAWAQSGEQKPRSKWITRRGTDYYISLKLGVVDIAINGAEVFGPIREHDLAREFTDLKDLVRSGEIDRDISHAWLRVRNTGKSRKVPRGFYAALARIKFGGNEARCRNYYKTHVDEKWLDVVRFERGEFS